MTRTVALILFPGFQILDVTGPLAAFEIAGRFAPDAYRVTLLAAAGGAIVASAGIALQAGPLGGAGSFDTILVSGGDGSRKAVVMVEEITDAIREQGAATNSIANQVDKMAHMAEESSAAAGASAEAAKTLDRLAAEMQRIVSHYKL